MNTEQQLTLQELIIARMPGHVYWKSPDGIYLGCNQQQAQTLGFENSQAIINKTDFDLPWKDQAEQIRRVDAEVLSNNKEFIQEEKVLIEGEPHIFLSRKVPLKDGIGNVLGILGISFDITDRKKMMNELKIAKEKAEVANTAKTNFIRNMEHDIRTPLSGLIGVVEYLAEHETEAKKKEVLLDARNAANELMTYCNNILDYARQAQCQTPIVEKPFDIRHILNQTLLMNIPAAKHKALKLLSNISKQVPLTLIGDNYRIKRILVNLIGNAIKFTETGEISIMVSCEQQLNQREMVIRIQVKDTGIGIPIDKQDIIYEKFTRINPSNQGIYKGAGLGLRVVKQYIDDLQGDIQLISKPNKGTLFTLDLPLKIPLVPNSDKRL